MHPSHVVRLKHALLSQLRLRTAAHLQRTECSPQACRCRTKVLLRIHLHILLRLLVKRRPVLLVLPRNSLLDSVVWVGLADQLTSELKNVHDLARWLPLVWAQES